MGVIPLCVACSSSSDETRPVSVGVRPAILDASDEADASSVDSPDATGTDSSSVGIIPYVPDASAEADAPSIGILPAVPDAAGSGDIGD